MTNKRNPVVEEVRAVRALLWHEAGGTISGLIRILDERQHKGDANITRKRGVKKKVQRQSPVAR